jgi:UDP-N-acetylglucosamine 4-epimerase
MYDTVYHNQDLSKHSFLITGGAGFIGSNLVEYLLKYRAKKVRVLDNFSTGFRHNIKGFIYHPSFELIEGDIRDFAVCQRAVNEIEYVLHQAALGSVPRSINDPITTNEVNVGGFLNMLVAAREARVNRFVYAASSSTYGDHPGLPKVEDKIGKPLSPYAITKYVNELYGEVFSKVYDFHTIGLRYFNVFGPKQNPKGAYAAVIPLFIDAALKKEASVIYGNGETSRDFTFIENAVQANIKALFTKNIDYHEIFNIAFGQSTKLNNLWKIICEIALIDINPKYNIERRGDVKHSLADISKADRVLDYKPIYSIQDGLKLTFEWYKNSSKK